MSNIFGVFAVGKVVPVPAWKAERASPGTCGGYGSSVASRRKVWRSTPAWTGPTSAGSSAARSTRRWICWTDWLRLWRSTSSTFSPSQRAARPRRHPCPEDGSGVDRCAARDARDARGIAGIGRGRRRQRSGAVARPSFEPSNPASVASTGRRIGSTIRPMIFDEIDRDAKRAESIYCQAQ